MDDYYTKWDLIASHAIDLASRPPSLAVLLAEFSSDSNLFVRKDIRMGNIHPSILVVLGRVGKNGFGSLLREFLRRIIRFQFRREKQLPVWFRCSLRFR